MRAKLTIDLAMLLCLLLALAYPLTGNAVHEILGIMFAVLCGAHTLCNVKWYATLHRTKHAPRQKLNAAVNVLLVIVVIVLMASSVFQSQTIFPFFKEDQTLFTRKIHTIAAYWIVILLGVHIGVHKNVITAALRKWTGVSLRSYAHKYLFSMLAVLTSVYGLYAFTERKLIEKLTGLHSFDYWDFESASGIFFAGYAAILVMMICITHCALFIIETHLHKKEKV